MEQREETVLRRVVMSFKGIYNNLIAGNKEPFERVIMLFISVTEELEEFICRADFYCTFSEAGCSDYICKYNLYITACI